MEHCYDYIKRQLGLTDSVEVSSFEENYKKLIKFGILKDCFDSVVAKPNAETTRKTISRILDVPTQLFQSIENDCRAKALDCDDEECVEIIDNRLLNDGANLQYPDDVDLLTLTLQNADLEKRKAIKGYRRICHRHWLSGVSNVLLEDKGRTSASNVEKAEIYSDSLLTVQIYRQPKINRNRAITIFPDIDQELIVLGRQHLTELRDAITCTSDLSVVGEFSEDPDQSQEMRTLDLYPSGFFFINNTFYNDMRRPDARDYSEVIRNWAVEKDRGVGTFTTQLMEATRFCDLTIELGFPYVYMHQGSCEHILVFSDLRLLGPYDNCNVQNYPMIERVFPKKRYPCRVCKIFTSKWITFENSRTTDDPFFYCDLCFRSFNYTKDGKKIGQFQAYPYIDPNAIN